MMAGEVIAEKLEAGNRLSDLLGLSADASRAILQDSVRHGYTEGSNYADGVYPKILAPIVRWGAMTGDLRSRLAPHEWNPETERGLETVVSPDKNLAIVAWSGDKLTGSPDDVDPSTVSHRGPVSMAAMLRGQTSLELTIRNITRQESTGTEVWVLLHHLAKKSDEIWWELSRPLLSGGVLTSRRKVRNWITRIPGEPIAYQVSKEERVANEATEKTTDVAVSRKASGG